MKALAVGGVADHVHVLVSLPASLSVAKAIQLLKGNSSKWVHEAFPKLRAFEWQVGYGAFSIGISGVEVTSSYIHGQEGHHRTRTFLDELQAMLRKHNLVYDEGKLD
jgi:REP-associated tyrosine transposase